MAKGKMTRCAECGKPFAAAAKSCPYCGEKNPLKKSPVLKILFSILAVFVLIGVVGAIFGGKDDSGEKKAPSSTKVDTKDDGKTSGESEPPEQEDQSEPSGKMIGAGDLGDYHVEINSAFLVEDYGENPALVVNYSWTNNSDETTSAMVAVHEKAFQDGVQLDPAILISVDGYEAGTSMKEVRPGTTIDIQCAFELTSNTSIVEFEISELISLSKDMVTMDFDPSSLG